MWCLAASETVTRTRYPFAFADVVLPYSGLCNELVTCSD